MLLLEEPFAMLVTASVRSSLMELLALTAFLICCVANLQGVLVQSRQSNQRGKRHWYLFFRFFSSSKYRKKCGGSFINLPSEPDDLMLTFCDLLKFGPAPVAHLLQRSLF